MKQGVFTEEELAEIYCYGKGLSVPPIDVLAHLSKNAYTKETGTSYENESLWIEQMCYQDKYFFTYAKLFFEIGTNRAVISWAGTETNKQWARGTIGMIFNELAWNETFKYCEEAVELFLKKYPKKDFYVTGHSAGGTIAQHASRVYRLGGGSFNAPGVDYGVLSIFLHSVHIYDISHPRFYNHVIKGDTFTYELCSFSDITKYYGTVIEHEKLATSPERLHSIQFFIEKHIYSTEDGSECSNENCNKNKVNLKKPWTGTVNKLMKIFGF